MAAGGYPGAYRQGDVISGLPSVEYPDTKVFHAGTKQTAKGIVTAGGRVLCICALGGTIQEAQANAYRLAEGIRWDNAYYRTDIGYKAIN
jgi:phosphoribosylamine--glycine ligase